MPLIIKPEIMMIEWIHLAVYPGPKWGRHMEKVFRLLHAQIQVNISVDSAIVLSAKVSLDIAQNISKSKALTELA